MALVSVGDRFHRVRMSLGLSTQAAIAAGLSWFVAYNLLGHMQPFFAPIAAVVVLAISVGQRLRRAIELVAGNAVGILLGEVIILIIGRGAWQVSLVVLLAILLAIFAGGSAPLVTQAASSASLVATLIPFGQNYFFSRFVDAVVGGSIGVGVMALLLPLNPLTVVQRAVGPILSQLAAGLTATARALKTRDEDLAMSTLDTLGEMETQLRAYSEGISAAKEIVAVAPLRWRSRSSLSEYVDAYPNVARALRNTRVLTRRVHTMIIEQEDVPSPLIDAIEALAEAVFWVRHELATGAEPSASHTAALRAVKLGADAYHGRLDFSGGVVVAQIRSLATDLMAAGGESADDIRREIRAVAKFGRKPPGK